MPRKGKKKKHSSTSDGKSQQASEQQQEKQEQTSAESSSQKQEKTSTSPLQQQVTPDSLQQQQQQKVTKDPQPQQISQGQQQTAWGPRQQTQSQVQPQAQPQVTPGSLQQQQQKITKDPQPQQISQGQQQTAWGPRQQTQSQVQPQAQPQVTPGSLQQQQQKVTKDPQPQQISQGQQQTAWGPRQQTQSQAQPQVQPQVQSQAQPQQQQQQQQVACGPRQQVPQGQQQTAWGPRQQVSQIQSQQQQQVARGPRQQVPQGQQQTAWGPQQQVPQAQPQQQQQQVAWGPRQQTPQGQQQTAWGPQQQVPQAQPQQQQQQVAWGPRQQAPQGQQQTAWGPQQQIPQAQPQQQQQVAWGPQQVSQGQQQTAWGPRQQVPQAQPQQQQVAWGPQQVPQSQQQTAWGPRQQISQAQPQQQQQVAWGPQQQVSQSQPQQRAWGPQQQVSPQQQQQASQQKQKASIDIGAGDQVPIDSGMHRQPQPSTSTGTFDLSELSSDIFHSEKTTKAKMSSDQLKSYHEMIPKRANPQKAGTAGQKITVWTNMFQIMFNDKFVTNAVHYDVTVKPFKEDSKKDPKKEVKIPKLPKALCRNIFEQCRNKHFGKRYPAYDGKKNAYSANDLPFADDMQDVFPHVNEDGQRKQYEIIVRKVANVDLSWIKNLRPGLAGNKDQTAIQVLDIIMRHAPESRYVNVGRSLFWNVNEEEQLGGGLALGRGGFMSGVLGWQPYLNVDVSHKGFTMAQRVLTYIAEVARVREENLTYNDVMRNKLKIQSFLRGLKVTYAIPNSPISRRTHRIIELFEDTCDSHTFETSDTKYTITRYFREIKKYNIHRKDLPTLHVGRTTNGGKVLLPLELCTIVGGQPINKKLDEIQTTNMIKKAATDAFTRKRRIEEAFNTINVNRSPVMEREFHLSVNPQMKQVDARILSPPELRYAERTATVAKGIWRLQPFSQAKHLETNSWTILNLGGTLKIDSAIQDFVKMLQTTAREVGMIIEQPERPFKSFRTDDLRNITEYFNKFKHLKLIIVIIPNHTDITYGIVKKITEMDVGVLTQCMKVQTLTRANPSTVKNILLKINSKLNGINHTLNTMPSCLSNHPCMLVGADVTHPAPDSKDIPSIAAVAASRNHLAFQYNIALRLQPPKEEMILDFEAIILSQLNIYYQETKRPPQKIIYYRDGVSEGQLPQVMYYEINAIKNAITKFNKGKIEVTCLVVQKRHHVRLFPSNPRETDDRNNNVKAGTIVDTSITHPDHIDFYLVSHASIQGTARPTKYRCICNDSKFNEDQLEQLTYYLCHMYARCTRSVSYPAPTYYAHLAAFRGRALIQGNKNFKLSDLEREQRNFKMKMAASPMYFV